MFALSLLLLVQAIDPSDSGPSADVTQFLDSEQRAFFSGDCSGTVDHWAPQFTMVVEGEVRASDRSQLLALCENVHEMLAARGIPARATGPTILKRDLFMLSDEIAYEVTLRRTPRGELSSVTKIVEHGDDGWQITHMHEAIAQPGRQAPGPTGPNAAPSQRPDR